MRYGNSKRESLCGSLRSMFWALGFLTLLTVLGCSGGSSGGGGEDSDAASTTDGTTSDGSSTEKTAEQETAEIVNQAAQVDYSPGQIEDRAEAQKLASQLSLGARVVVADAKQSTPPGLALSETYGNFEGEKYIDDPSLEIFDTLNRVPCISGVLKPMLTMSAPKSYDEGKSFSSLEALL